MAGDVENPDEDMAETIDYPVDSVFESVLNEFTETIVGNRLWSKGQSGSNADSIKPQRASEASEESPSFIGRYQIHSILGKGAFGAVYRGHDPQLARDVAIKVPLTRAIADSAEALRIQAEFLEEARRLAGLSHPGIVKVLDVAADEGTCYTSFLSFLTAPI